MISLINVVGKTGQLHAKESKQTTFSHQMDKDLSIRLEAIKLLKKTQAICSLNLPSVQETWVQSLGWKDPRRRKWQPPPVFLPGESHGQRSLSN